MVNAILSITGHNQRHSTQTMNRRNMSNQQETDPKLKRQTAVALKATGADDPAPRITAVGHGENAARMLDLAFANNVKVRRDEDLTQILSAMEAESPVPLEALEAVGEILTYVYQANNSWSASPSGDISLDTTKI